MKRVVKTVWICLVLLAVAGNALSQSLDGYFEARGVEHLCQAAHASNDYLSGEYDVHSRYVDVSIKSRDNVFGATIHTDLRLVRGEGDLFFSKIIVQGDDDMVKPFEAFGLQVGLMTSIMKSMDKETYDKMRRAVQETFNTDFEHWTGKMWALLAINLDYYEYMAKGK